MNRTENKATLRWVFTNARAQLADHGPDPEDFKRRLLAARLRARVPGSFPVHGPGDSPILLAGALGWQCTDNGAPGCGPAARRQFEGVLAAPYHKDAGVLEMRIGHRLCGAELYRAGLPHACSDAWLLLEQLYLPEDELAYLTIVEATARLWWAPAELVHAFAARHPSHDRVLLRSSPSRPHLAAVLPLRRQA